MVYHARYLEFLERGRSDFLRLADVHHTELAEGKHGETLVWVVKRMEIDFRASARIDDILVIDTRVAEVSGARIAGENRVATSMYLEPSGHVRVTDRLLAFAGVAPGVLYNGDDWGFTIRTRAGVDVLVGRSGIFRPALTFTWATRDLYGTTGTQLPGMRRVGGLEISYAAMF